MSRVVPLLLLAALAAPAWSAAPAPAPVPAPAPAPTPDKVVVYRQKVMKVAGSHLSLASMIAKGEIARPQDAMMHSVALHEAARATLELFPAGTGPDKIQSDARPEVWTDWKGFETAAQAYEAETAKLVEAAKESTLDNWKAQLGKVGDSCGACHDKFRVEDPH
jgi:cytochrome c556